MPPVSHRLTSSLSSISSLFNYRANKSSTSDNAGASVEPSNQHESARPAKLDGKRAEWAKSGLAVRAAQGLVVKNPPFEIKLFLPAEKGKKKIATAYIVRNLLLKMMKEANKSEEMFLKPLHRDIKEVLESVGKLEAHESKGGGGFGKPAANTYLNALKRYEKAVKDSNKNFNKAYGNFLLGVDFGKKEEATLLTFLFDGLDKQLDEYWALKAPKAPKASKEKKNVLLSHRRIPSIDAVLHESMKVDNTNLAKEKLKEELYSAIVALRIERGLAPASGKQSEEDDNALPSIDRDADAIMAERLQREPAPAMQTDAAQAATSSTTIEQKYGKIDLSPGDGDCAIHALMGKRVALGNGKFRRELSEEGIVDFREKLLLKLLKAADEIKDDAKEREENSNLHKLWQGLRQTYGWSDAKQLLQGIESIPHGLYASYLNIPGAYLGDEDIQLWTAPETDEHGEVTEKGKTVLILDPHNAPLVLQNGARIPIKWEQIGDYAADTEENKETILLRKTPDHWERITKPSEIG